MDIFVGAILASLMLTSAYGDAQFEDAHLDAYQVLVHRDPALQYVQDGLIKEEVLEYGTSLNFVACLICPSSPLSRALGGRHLAWKSRVHGEGSRSQFRWVGWEWDLAMDLASDGRIQAFHRHHSQHFMDRDGRHDWPLQDYVGFRFKMTR